jgi:hypothetical protein
LTFFEENFEFMGANLKSIVIFDAVVAAEDQKKSKVAEQKLFVMSVHNFFLYRLSFILHFAKNDPPYSILIS